MKGAVRLYILIAVLYARALADILLLEPLASFSMALLISMSLILALRPNTKPRLAFSLLLPPDHTYNISHRALFAIYCPVQDAIYFYARLHSIDSLCFQCALPQRKCSTRPLLLVTLSTEPSQSSALVSLGYMNRGLSTTAYDQAPPLAW